ncbi:MAG TPA: hypothetical protein VMU41_01060 [Candidatus Binataceae bacterium]|nr:hypothetical protein [Candidatus Binataceae bacterium]
MANSLLRLLRLSVKLWTWQGTLWIAENSGRVSPRSLSDWIHFEAIQLLVYHASAVVTALVLSALVGFVIQRLMRDGPIKRLVILIDELFVAGVILFLVAEMVLHLWRR